MSLSKTSQKLLVAFFALASIPAASAVPQFSTITVVPRMPQSSDLPPISTATIDGVVVPVLPPAPAPASPTDLSGSNYFEFGTYGGEDATPKRMKRGGADAGWVYSPLSRDIC